MNILFIQTNSDAQILLFMAVRLFQILLVELLVICMDSCRVSKRALIQTAQCNVLKQTLNDLRYIRKVTLLHSGERRDETKEVSLIPY